MSDQPTRSDRTEILGSDRHLRRDAKDIVDMIGLGVLPRDRVEGFIKKAANLIDETGATGKAKSPRNFAALMRVMIAAAKLEVSAAPKEHNHEHTHAVVTDDERRTIVRARELLVEAQSRGLIEGAVIGEVLPSGERNEVLPPQAVRQATDLPGP